MTIRKIASIGHPVLRTRARELETEELASEHIQRLIDDLIDTMRDANGAGLAANQIHETVRICVIEVNQNPRYPYKPDIPLTILVNPVLTLLGTDRYENNEGCLSVPNLRGNVWRHLSVRVQALDRDGGVIDDVKHGLTAGTFQHEVDHLDGVLFVDRVEDPTTFSTWDQFDRYHRAAFVERISELVARVGS
jgi:peptide deformylase